jgi:site-specific recombinase XerD
MGMFTFPCGPDRHVRVRQSKTGVESHLPLVGPVGEALLKYLQKGRPKTDARECLTPSGHHTVPSAVPLKAIGELLGHRSATSTEVYLI